MVKGSELATKAVLSPTDSLYVIDNDGAAPASKNTSAAQVINPTPIYGELSVTDDVSLLPTQTSISTSYTKINQFNVISAQNGITVDLANNEFTILEDGIYTISLGLSHSGDGGLIYDVAIHVNDIEVKRSLIRRTISAANDIGRGATFLIESFSAGDKIHARVKTTLAGSHDFTMQSANFVVSKSV